EGNAVGDLHAQRRRGREPAVTRGSASKETRMHRLVIPALALLLLAAPARAADRKFDPDAAAKAVAPFLDDSATAVAHADLTRLDVHAVTDWLAKLAHLEEEDVAGPGNFFRTAVEALTGAGARDVFLVHRLADSRKTLYFVVPLER